METIKNKKILLVDDEKELLKLVKDALYKEGFYRVFTAETCAEARAVAEQQNPALCLLDVCLPDGDGFSLFEDIRRRADVPVIFLTARGEPDDKLQGLGLGADDYIVKPFLMKELVLRVTAVLKRIYGRTEEPAAAGFWLGSRYIDFETASVQADGRTLSFTAKEFVLLRKLYENKNKIVTSDALCEAAWGDGYYGYENTLMVHIRRLREKIEDNPSHPAHLITVKGIGYKLVMEHE